MAMPILILAEPASVELQVAGLALLDRLAVSAHRAAGGPVTLVCPVPVPPLKRAKALGIPVKVVTKRPAMEEATLVMAWQAFAQVGDLQRMVTARGRLCRADGRPLPAGVLEEDFTHLDKALDRLDAVTAQGVAEYVDCPVAARRAGGRLWASLTSSSDGVVDRYVNRPVGRLLSKALVGTVVSPNQVSVVATLMGVASGWLLAQGEFALSLWGVALLQASAVVDCVDGDLARAAYKESRFGRWLDLGGDQVVHVAIFAGLTVGLLRAGVEAPILALGVSAVVGVVISFLVVLRGLLRPQLLQNTPLQRLIDATTNRDFSVLLLLLAAAGRLEWFLWLTAVGVHVFWLTALVLQLKGNPSPTAGRQSGA